MTNGQLLIKGRGLDGGWISPGGSVEIEISGGQLKAKRRRKPAVINSAVVPVLGKSISRPRAADRDRFIAYASCRTRL